MNIIVGRSGTGKTKLCMNQIKDEILKACNKPLIYIVPEQFTFEAEKELIEISGKDGIMDVQVYSFKRLAYKVFNELGYQANIIGNAGKNILIYFIMLKLEKDLKILKGVSKNTGLVDTVSSQISEFKRYNLTPDILKNLKVSNEYLSLKLNDLWLIYSAYEEYINDKYIDMNDELTVLKELLERNTFLNNSKIWIDEFDGFTPQEFEIIKKLNDISELTVSIIADESSELFKLNNKTLNKILKISEKNDITYLKDFYRFNSNELLHLEKNIFRFPYDAYKDEVKNITISLENNSYFEIENIARMINNYVRKEKMRYENIAILSKDLSEYEKLFKIIFKQYNIPFFIDRKRELYSQPLMSLVLSLFDICMKNYSYESIFTYLKTGLANIDDINDIDMLENYVLKWGITGKTWLQNWELADVNLEKINLLREQTINPIEEFKDSFGTKKTVKEIIVSLYNFLVSIGTYENIQNKISKLKETNELVAIEIANQYTQVWNILIKIFDEMVDTIGDEFVSFEKFRNIFKLAISNYDMGLIPSTKDQVIIGDIERTRNNNVKVLFVIGMNDGKFPMIHSDEGFINDAERDILLENGIEIAKNTKVLLEEENFNLYKAFCVPNDKLHLSCPISTLEGKALRKSFVLNNLKKIFPTIIEKETFLEVEINIVSTPDATFGNLLKEIKQYTDGDEPTETWKNVYAWYKNNQEEKINSVVQAIEYNNTTSSISKNSAIKLYGKDLNSSVSRLERFVMCPYSYYLEYGLKAKERQIYKLETPDVGTFLHEIIEKFSKHMLEESISWREVTKEYCDEIINSLVDETLKNFKHNLLNSTGKLKQLGIRLKRLVKRMIWIIVTQIKSGEFEVVGSEVEFGRKNANPAIEIELSDGNKMFLNGKIDRVDMADTEDGKYIRIIDYKSSAKQIKLSDVYYGLQLQLITYMDAIATEELMPGGVLYLKLDDPIVKSNKDLSKEEIEEQIINALRMKGLVLSNARLIKAMDSNMTNESSVINLSVKKDGSYSKMPTVTSEEFDKLRNHIRKTLKELGEEILSGNIKNEPVKKKDISACDYCKYKVICQFDKDLGNKFKYINELKDAETLDKMDARK